MERSSHLALLATLVALCATGCYGKNAKSKGDQDFDPCVFCIRLHELQHRIFTEEPGSSLSQLPSHYNGADPCKGYEGDSLQQCTDFQTTYAAVWAPAMSRDESSAEVYCELVSICPAAQYHLPFYTSQGFCHTCKTVAASSLVVDTSAPPEAVHPSIAAFMCRALDTETRLFGECVQKLAKKLKKRANKKGSEELTDEILCKLFGTCFSFPKAYPTRPAGKQYSQYSEPQRSRYVEAYGPKRFEETRHQHVRTPEIRAHEVRESRRVTVRTGYTIPYYKEAKFPEWYKPLWQEPSEESESKRKAERKEKRKEKRKAKRAAAAEAAEEEVPLLPVPKPPLESSPEPVASTEDDVAPILEPVASTEDDVAPILEPVASTEDDVAPILEPVASTEDDVAPILEPVASTEDVVVEAPLSPPEASIAVEEAPAASPEALAVEEVVEPVAPPEESPHEPAASPEESLQLEPPAEAPSSPSLDVQPAVEVPQPIAPPESRPLPPTPVAQEVVAAPSEPAPEKESGEHELEHDSSDERMNRQATDDSENSDLDTTHALDLDPQKLFTEDLLLQDFLHQSDVDAKEAVRKEEYLKARARFGEFYRYGDVGDGRIRLSTRKRSVAT